MRNIKIFLKNGNVINLKDKDDTDIEDYVRNICSIMKNSDIQILETTLSNLGIRSTAIEAILVEEEKEIAEDIQEEEQVDMITEVDE